MSEGRTCARAARLVQVKPSDSMLVVCYPHFNPRGVAQACIGVFASALPSERMPTVLHPPAEELSAARELDTQVAKPKGLPLIIFNGELDRLRGKSRAPALAVAWLRSEGSNEAREGRGAQPAQLC